MNGSSQMDLKVVSHQEPDILYASLHPSTHLTLLLNVATKIKNAIHVENCQHEFLYTPGDFQGIVFPLFCKVMTGSNGGKLSIASGILQKSNAAVLTTTIIAICVIPSEASHDKLFGGMHNNKGHPLRVPAIIFITPFAL